MSTPANPFGSRGTLQTAAGKVTCYDLNVLGEAGVGHVQTLPFSIRVLLESLLRHADGNFIGEDDVAKLASWDASAEPSIEIPFHPARVILQDFTGVPAVVDLAALRDACRQLGGDPQAINPLVPCDLVIDHSVQVDHFGRNDALALNLTMEFERNRQRYEFLKWGRQAFDNFRVVPPGTGIIHQVNLEYLAQVVMVRDGVAMADSLVGTDSHTTMINGLGVVGWGVGGIEAEAVMLGQPIYMLTPQVVGFKLTGKLPEGATATDAVLTVTQMLRRVGVVGRFVEFFGPGVKTMPLPDRATIANMAPEYGATMGFFPVDELTLDYLRLTGRDERTIDLVERYCKRQGLWADDSSSPTYTQVVELDLGTVEPSLAGPKRPQDRITLGAMKATWYDALQKTYGKTLSAVADPTGLTEAPAVAVVTEDVGFDGVAVQDADRSFTLKHGAVVIAAITSCTNTSNPDVLIAAGLLAKNAVARGLSVQPWVKTSLAPGSRVVSDYLEAAGLSGALDQLGFQTVGYGCTTCIGNSGPLAPPIARAIEDNDLVVASVLSGNRNFEGRINPHVKANYLASPPLVVAYAIAGSVSIDLATEPIGTDCEGQPVYLRDVWPSNEQIRQAVREAVRPEQFARRYADVDNGDEQWQKIAVSDEPLYRWSEQSTYIRRPPFFEDMTTQPQPIGPIESARVLCLLGDSVTTDHISPAGAFEPDSPAGQYLQACGVEPRDFNSYGSRRGNHEVMMRGTFANIRIRNQLAPGTEGGWTCDFTDGQVRSIYDAAMNYKQQAIPLIVLAGRDYGMGSSRDWAAKGTALLGVRAVIAQSYERIHRSNLIGMGVLPLQFNDGDDAASLGLTGREVFDIAIDDAVQPGQLIEVTAADPDSDQTQTFVVTCRIDTPVEVDYYRHGGILQAVLRKLVTG